MSERFEELYERYADATLTQEERQEFIALLRDAKHRAQLVQLAVFEAVVSDELRLAKGQEHGATPVGQPSASGGESVRVRPHQNVCGQKPVTLKLPARAALVVAAIVLLIACALLLKDSNSGHVPPKLVEPTAPSTTAFAHVVRATNGVLRRAGQPARPLRAGLSICAEDELETQSGSTVIRFSSDPSLLTLNGPVRLQCGVQDGSKRLKLSRGSLDAEIAAQRQQFPLLLQAGPMNVYLSGATVTAVVSDRQSRLEVLKGSARVHQEDQEEIVPLEHFALWRPGQQLFIAPLKGEKFRVITYNLSQSLDEDDLSANAEVIRRSGADIAGIQKVRRDGPAAPHDRLLKLCNDLGGWHYAFVALSPATGVEDGKVFIDQALQEGQSCVGNAIISRLPIVSARARLLTYNPPPDEQWKEKRAVLQATLRLPSGRSLNIFCSHFSINDQENVKHVEELVQFASEFAGARVAVGNLHLGPHRAQYEKLKPVFADAWTEAGKGDGFTIPVPVARWRADLILFDKQALNIGQALLGGRGLSDHYSVIAEFYFPWE